jgi:hypothetical protein
MPDHVGDRGAAHLDPGASRSPHIKHERAFPRKPSQQEACQVGGVNAVPLLVTVADVGSGKIVTDSDRRAGGFLRMVE